jgi:hypothetical protein
MDALVTILFSRRRRHAVPLPTHSREMAMSSRRLRPLATAVLLWTCALPASAQTYEKFMLFDDVKAGAAIEGGALVQTWSPGRKNGEKVTFHAGITRLFDRANPISKTANVNGADLALIIKPVPGVAVAYGAGHKAIWDPAEITVIDDKDHTPRIFASSDIVVHTNPVLETWVKDAKGVPKWTKFKNVVGGSLYGTVEAGKPTDGHANHSANSFAGIHIVGAKTFTKIGGPDEVFHLAGINVVAYAGTARINGEKPDHHHIDPFFLTVNDLTTGVSTRSEIMRTTIRATGADIFMDDTAIRLAIDRRDPLSSVSLAFSSETPWVTDPYGYGFTLDNSGLTVAGDAHPPSGPKR